MISALPAHRVHTLVKTFMTFTLAQDFNLTYDIDRYAEA